MSVHNILRDRNEFKTMFDNSNLSSEVKAFKKNQEELENQLQENLQDKANIQKSINNTITKIIPNGSVSSFISESISDFIESSKEINKEIRGLQTTEDMEYRLSQYNKDKEKSNPNLIHSQSFLDWKKDNDESFKEDVKNSNKKNMLMAVLSVSSLAVIFTTASPVLFSVAAATAIVSIKNNLTQDKTLHNISQKADSRISSDSINGYNQEFDKIYEKVQRKLNNEQNESLYSIEEPKVARAEIFRPEHHDNEILDSLKSQTKIKTSNLKNEISEDISQRNTNKIK